MLSNYIKYFSIVLFSLIQLSSLFGQDVKWDELIEKWRTEYHVPGMSVGIIKDGKVVLSSGYGVLEEGKKTKVDENTLFSIASNTKAFITASIAKLVDEGKMNWDDRVQTYLPYFELYDPCVSEMMTVRDLLCHRSGLGTFSGDVIWYRSEYSAEEVVRRVAALPQNFEFRSGFGYSNVMFLAAGEVIRKVSGKKWDEYVKENFIRPLHMNRTTTSTNEIYATSNIATPHKPQGDHEVPIEWVNWDNMGAAGGIISSSTDMLKWMALQLDHGIEGTDTFFTAQSQTTMWTPHNNFPVSQRAHQIYGRNFNGYGLGWGLGEYQGHFVASHTGGYDGMYSSVMLLPNEHIGIVVLTNAMHSIGPMLSNEIIDKLLDLPQGDWEDRGLKQDQAAWKSKADRIEERMKAHETGTKPTMSAEEISGLYRDPMYGDIRIEHDGTQLMIDFTASPGLKAKLSHWHHDVYQIEWLKPQAWFSFGTVQILKDNNAKPDGLLFDVPNDDIFFEEIKAVRVNK
ncbi:MAG: serine hydrolase [Saprospiraceae bacterium]|uniref:Serine hydrolase n=1 Tax=Candidatus Opimibacter skivensis TaxID=2982028 RepID=A0A9D7SWP3_9BACT|nr:serine hydrolase [Candidatus Opimibacter skivensis]